MFSKTIYLHAMFGIHVIYYIKEHKCNGFILTHSNTSNKSTDKVFLDLHIPSHPMLENAKESFPGLTENSQVISVKGTNT